MDFFDPKNWRFVNQYNQANVHSSNVLRSQLLLRNYFLASLALSEHQMGRKRHQELKRHIPQIADPQPVEFKEIFELLNKEGNKTVKFLTFGSLMNETSAAFDIGSKGHPALTFGLRRIFNFEPPAHAISRLGLPTPGFDEEVARLNVAQCNRGDSPLCGVLHALTLDEVKALEKREQGYQLVKVSVVDYEAAYSEATPKIEIAYVLVADQPAPSEPIKPHLNYLNVCLEGALAHGRGFLSYFLSSTFLSDGTTPLIEFLRQELVDLACPE